MMEKELYQKMLDGRLTKAELDEFRRRVAMMTDDSLNEMIDSGVSNSQLPSAQALCHIRENINLQIEKYLRRRHFMRILSMAAMILLPLTIGCLVFFYIRFSNISDYSGLISSEFSISTTADEYLKIALPDGSTADLDPSSELSYSMKNFSDIGRTVSFSGDAFFDIASKSGVPFYIDAEGVTVIVKGTSFMLSAQPGADKVALYLETGKVELLSKITGKSISVRPGQLAMMNYPDGNFELCRADNRNDARAIARGDLIFQNTPLGEVLNAIEHEYGIEINTSENIADNTFTGYIPANNLDEAVRLLESSLNCSSKFSDNVLFLMKK